MDGHIPTVTSRYTSPTMLSRELERLHQEYLLEPHDPKHDAAYVLTATQLMMETCLLPAWERVPYSLQESYAYYKLAQPRN